MLLVYLIYCYLYFIVLIYRANLDHNTHKQPLPNHGLNPSLGPSNLMEKHREDM